MSLEETGESLFVENLRCGYPGFGIEADFHVGPEERVAVFSPSGTGKSTLVRILAGLETEATVTGLVRVGERSMLQDPPEQRNIGVVFQEGLLFPHMTAWQNVAYPLKLRGVGPAERLKLASQWIEKLELGNRLDHYPHELSGGERQRIAFARALVFRPRLIILDEAFSALDVKLREHLSTVLAEIHRELRVPLLFVTHDLGERERLATRVLQHSTDESRTLHRFVD